MEVTIEMLPMEVLEIIFSYIPINIIVTDVRKVCRKWAGIIDTCSGWIVEDYTNVKWIQEVLGSTLINERLVSSLKSITKNVRQLLLSSNANMDLISFMIKRNLKYLEHLDISQTIDENIISDIIQCTHLKILRISVRSNISLFKGLGDCAWSLDELNVCIFPNNIDFVEYYMRRKGKDLKRLMINNYSVGYSSDRIKSFWNIVFNFCISLKSLTIEDVNDWSDSLLVDIYKCSNLTELHINADKLTGQCLLHISLCKQIQDLHLIQLKEIDTAYESEIFQLVKLETLIIPRATMSVNCLIAMTNTMSHLKRICLKLIPPPIVTMLRSRGVVIEASFFSDEDDFSDSDTELYYQLLDDDYFLAVW